MHVRRGRPCPGLSHPCLGIRATRAREVASSARLTRTEDTSPVFEVTVCPPGGAGKPRASSPQLSPGYAGGSRHQEPCLEVRTEPAPGRARGHGAAVQAGDRRGSRSSPRTAKRAQTCVSGQRRTSPKYLQDKTTVLKASHFPSNEPYQKQLAHFPRVSTSLR